MTDIISQADKAGALDPARLAGVEPVRRIAGRNSTKADVLFFDLSDQRVAVKSYAPRSALIRNTLGRWLIRREAAAYEAAAEVAALPAFLGRLSPYVLATEWVDAEPLKARTGALLDDVLFDRLAAILDELHGRGVALADLHHRDVLLTADGSIYLEERSTLSSIERLRFLSETFPRSIWLNPVLEVRWGYTQTIQMIRGIFPMFELSLDGLENAVVHLMARN